jgi:hypothetical protein
MPETDVLYGEIAYRASWAVHQHLYPTSVAPSWTRLQPEMRDGWIAAARAVIAAWELARKAGKQEESPCPPRQH